MADKFVRKTRLTVFVAITLPVNGNQAQALEIAQNVFSKERHVLIPRGHGESVHAIIHPVAKRYDLQSVGEQKRRHFKADRNAIVQNLTAAELRKFLVELAAKPPKEQTLKSIQQMAAARGIKIGHGSATAFRDTTFARHVGKVQLFS